MARYLCDSCSHLKGTLFKTYRVDGILYREEYADCSKRWPMAKVMRGCYCYDYEKGEGK